MSICLSNKDDCSWHMPRCGHMFHDKCIQTWKASCKSEPSYEVCPQCRKPFRKFLSFYKQRGRSHARILRPSSSHKLDIILIALELPVSIYCETVIQLCVRRFHSYPPHPYTCPFRFLQRALSNFASANFTHHSQSKKVLKENTARARLARG